MSLCLRRGLRGLDGWMQGFHRMLIPSVGCVNPQRHSTSHTSYSADHGARLRRMLTDTKTLHSFVESLTRKERKELLKKLSELNDGEDFSSTSTEETNSVTNGNDTVLPPDKQAQFQLAIVNAVPFVGFGFLDNAIMIVAGESIELTLGTVFAISTMAAAAMGNLISDVAGIGLASGVESLANRLGLPNPDLSPEQLRLPSVRRISYLGRGIGLCIGCIFGMFPLLFLGHSKQSEDSSNS